MSTLQIKYSFARQKNKSRSYIFFTIFSSWRGPCSQKKSKYLDGLKLLIQVQTTEVAEYDKPNRDELEVVT